MSKASVTFLLPGDNRSGGVRVTAVMGNLLLARGYDVRIVHPARWRRWWANPGSLLEATGGPRRGWLHTFSGPIVPYLDLNRVSFAPREIVIAVGTYMIEELHRLRAPQVVKVRYNHGFPAHLTPAYRAAWSRPIPTVTVSPTLVPQLEALSGRKVCAVIPNGIDREMYSPIPGAAHDAIGTIFSLHPNKAPQDIVRLLQRIGTDMPELPRLVFGTERRPAALAGCHYERAPVIARVRELYNRAMIWLLASHTEGLPGPVLEAMACGTVVISTDNDGSLAAIRDGHNGLIVPRGDIDAFLAAIRRVRGDGKLRARLIEGGFETVARFTWASAADRMEEFLATLIASPVAASA